MNSLSKTFGKVILAGEHAVVYGKMALVTSISLGVRAYVGRAESKQKYNEIISKAIKVAGGDDLLEIKIESELPAGSGLGSSAAIAAAVVKGVREYLGKVITEDELFELTLECEKVAHGNPSGVDPAAVVYGGLIAYVKGQPFEKLMITRLVTLLLVDTGKPTESTREMVEMVAAKEDKERIINQIGELSGQVKVGLIRGEEVNELLNQNGLLLEELGVVGKRAKELSDGLRQIGCSVKITGAGGVATGSGMMIVMSRDLQKTKAFLDKRNVKHFEVTVGGK